VCRKYYIQAAHIRIDHRRSDDPRLAHAYDAVQRTVGFVRNKLDAPSDGSPPMARRAARTTAPPLT